MRETFAGRPDTLSGVSTAVLSAVAQTPWRYTTRCHVFIIITTITITMTISSCVSMITRVNSNSIVSNMTTINIRSYYNASEGRHPREALAEAAMQYRTMQHNNTQFIGPADCKHYSCHQILSVNPAMFVEFQLAC